jgi:hypothetical protein
MSKFSIATLFFATWALVGCSSEQAASGPAPGQLNMEGLTIDQQIEKVQNDKTIPAQYKETYINSLKAKAGKS